MFTKNFIGWISLVLFIIAAMTLGFLILLTLLSAAKISAQFMLLIAGGFALAAAVTGFSTLSTSPGKVGGIGGLTLSVVVTFVFLFTAIARVERGTVQQPVIASIPPTITSAAVGPVNATPMPAPVATRIAAVLQNYCNNYTGFEPGHPSIRLIGTSNETPGAEIL